MNLVVPKLQLDKKGTKEIDRSDHKNALLPKVFFTGKFCSSNLTFKARAQDGLKKGLTGLFNY
jgi:hypothetical protein